MAQQHTSALLASVRSLFARAPMLRVALAMVGGILLGEYCVSLPLWLSAAFVGLGIVVVALLAQWRPASRVFILVLWLTFVMFGWLYHSLRQPRNPFPQSAKTTYVAQLADNPVPTAKCYKVKAQVYLSDHSTSAGSIMLFIAQDSASASLHYGHRLRITSVPVLPRDAESPGQFSYRRFLRHNGMLWQSYVPSGSWQIVDTHPASALVAFAKKLQHHLVGQIQALPLTPSQQGICEALVLGWRHDIDDTTRRQFRDAGISHLLCVSGLHVGIFAYIVGGLFFFLGRLRWQRIVKGSVQLVAIWLFVLLTGMAPSTTRAALMFSLMLLGHMMQRGGASLNHLATSAVVLLLVNPMVLFDVGFQLSYAAVLGIIAWHGPLLRLFPFPDDYTLLGHWKLLQKICSWICLSTAAQLATLPLVLFHFHQFPLYFLIANLTLVPFAGVLLATVLLMTLTGGWLIFVVCRELMVVDSLTRWVSALPSAVCYNIYCDIPVALMILLAQLFFTAFLYSAPRC